MLTLDIITSILKNAPAASLVLHNDAPGLTIAYTNPAFDKMLGGTTLPLRGKPISNFLVQQYAESRSLEFLTNLDRIITLQISQTEGLDRLDFIQANLPGENFRFYKWEAYPLVDPDVHIKFIVVNLIDVTSELVSSPGIQVSAVPHHADEPVAYHFFNEYPDAIFTLNLEGRFLTANKFLTDITECSFEELFQLSFTAFISGVELDKGLINFAKARKGEIINFDTQIRSCKNNLKTLNITNLPIIVNHEVTGVYVIAKDITATTQIKLQLEQQREKLDEYHTQMSNILESITDGFFAVDRNWIVTYWNKEAETILQLPREAIMGQHFLETFQKVLGAEAYDFYQQVMYQRISVNREGFYQPLQIWLEISAFPSQNGISVYFKDITTRKEADQKLTEAKKQYQDLFNLSPLPQWVYNKDTFAFKDVNQAAINHYGYSRDEFLSMTIKDIRPSEDIALIEKILKNTVKEKEPNIVIVRHLKKNGEMIYVRVEGSPISFRGKNARLVLAVDMTEILKAEQALIISEQKFKALVQDGSDIIAILDIEGNYSYVNATSNKILGIPPSYFLGKNAFDFIHEDDRGWVEEKFKMLSTEARIAFPPFRFKDGFNRFRWIETVVTNMIDDPAVNGLVANSRDVTERFENEIKIQENIERFNIVSKATSDALWDFDATTGIVVWNQAINELFGYSTNTFTRAWWLLNIHPEDLDRVQATVNSAIQHKQSRIEIEYRFQSASQGYRVVLDRSFLIYNTDGDLTRMIGSMQDITERISYLQKVEEQNQLLKDISWTQSHLVRAPLARVLSLSKLIADYKEDHQSVQELLSHLETSAVELDEIIREIIKKSELLNKE
jgi:PAS domain S-box-containing protein